MNKRRIKRGGGPMRYTGWTVPSYNQSQAQYGYPTNQQGGAYGQNAYNMNSYPPYGQQGAQGAQGAYGQQGQYNYSQPTNASAANTGHASNQAYYDATQTEAQNGRAHLRFAMVLMLFRISTPRISSAGKGLIDLGRTGRASRFRVQSI
jgi:Chitin synthesis regulation, resistance to Congo red